ncbi:MAG: hypothetical protein WDO19_23255 [Bacteroidota bacterium]
MPLFYFKSVAVKQQTHRRQLPTHCPAATTSTLGGVIVGTGLSVNSSGVLSATPSNYGLTQKDLIFFVRNLSSDNSYEYWLANIDGTNQHKLNIVLTPTVSLSNEAKLSPDGTKIIFVANDNTAGHDDIYSVSVTGGSPTKIVDGSASAITYINGV